MWDEEISCRINLHCFLLIQFPQRIFLHVQNKLIKKSDLKLLRLTLMYPFDYQGVHNINQAKAYVKCCKTSLDCWTRASHFIQLRQYMLQTNGYLGLPIFRVTNLHPVVRQTNVKLYNIFNLSECSTDSTPQLSRCYGNSNQSANRILHSRSSHETLVLIYLVMSIAWLATEELREYRRGF